MPDFVRDLIFRDLLPSFDQWKSDVVEYVHVRPDSVRLEHHADVALFCWNVNSSRRRVRHCSGDFQLSGVRPLEARDAPQRGRFAATAGTEQDAKLLLCDFQINAAQRLHPAAPAIEPFSESANGDQENTLGVMEY